MSRRPPESSPEPPRPPRVARWILRRLVPGTERDDVDRSLRELYRLRATEHGPASAQWWYWRQLLGFLFRSRSVRPSAFARTLADDFRHAARTLAYRPAFTLLAVMILGTGIGANTIVFSVLDPALFRPLPFPDADRLVSVRARRADRETGVRPRYAEFRAWSAAERRSADAFAAYQGRWKLLSRTDAVGEEALVTIVSPRALELSGAEIVLGRTLLPEDFTASAEPTVVITRALWQSAFGNAPEVLGQTLKLNGTDHVIVGVASDFALHTLPTQALTPLKPAGAGASGQREPVEVIARLSESATEEQLAAELRGLDLDEAGTGPMDETERIPVVLPIREELYGWAWDRYSPFLGIVGFVLLLVAANIANLMLVTATNRRGEFAVRAALGAGRWRLARQVAAEIALLTAAAIAAGLLLAYWGVLGLLAWDPLNVVNVAPRFDHRLVMFGAVVGVLAGGIAGIGPALTGVRVPTARAFGSSQGQATPSSGRLLAQRSLMVLQISCSLILLAGAGLLTKTTLRMHRYDPGVETANLLSFYSTNDAAISGPDRSSIPLLEQLLERMRAVPGVNHASASASGGSLATESGRSEGGVTLENRGVVPAPLTEDAYYSFVSDEHFDTLGVELLRGRGLESADTGAEVAVINEKAARRWWPETSLPDVVGRRFKLGASDSGEPWITVIGVSATYGSVYVQLMDSEPGPRVYLPLAAATPPLSNLSFSVRTSDDPLVLIQPLGAAAAEIVPGILLRYPQHVHTAMQQEIGHFSVSGKILTGFAGFGLLLALLGIYGVVAQSVARRTREIGIRKALGAEARDVVGAVAGDSLALGLVGIVIGLGLSAVTTRVLSSMLYGTDPLDPLVLATVSALLAITVAIAAYVPARRATRMDPMVALREE